MKPFEWHERFLQQAEWSRSIRAFILKKIQLQPAAKVIEIGCGTGAITDDLQGNISSNITGLDLNPDFLQFFRKRSANAQVVAADGYESPFPNDYFDLVYCHFLLLWIKNPVNLMLEMRRISNKNGWVCCFAEPDYHGRIDFSEHDHEIGQLQNQSLRQQGVNLETGRQMTSWFLQAGFESIQWGIMGTQRTYSSIPENDESETKILQYDLNQLLNQDFYSRKILSHSEDDIKVQFTSFIPTFYAYAQNGH